MQMCFILARHQLFLECLEDNETYCEIASNSHLNEHFLYLVKDLDIIEPKLPEDIYKMNIESTRSSFNGLDSARYNLASTFVNAFVNCGFGQDKLITVANNKWINKNKDEAMMSAAGSIGLILLWNVEKGLNSIDKKFLYSKEDHVKAGALLACGIISCNIRIDCDPARALLSDYVEHTTPKIQVGAIMGLGIAYSGTNREDVIDLLLPCLNVNATNEILGITSIALGLICAGTANSFVTQALLACLIEKVNVIKPNNVDLNIHYMSLGIALCYLGLQESSEAIQEALKVMCPQVYVPAVMLVDICSYAGTGNVLKIQEILHVCIEKISNDKSNIDIHQRIAVIGIALIGMGEDVGSEMIHRIFNHLLQYGHDNVRRYVPLALGLLCASNPKLSVIDTLGKLSHDVDDELVHNSILALGLIGCGTNNARIAHMLRQLANFYHKDAENLFITRIAQGLLHLGKGTMGISPFYSGNNQLSFPRIASILSLLISCLDIKNTILGQYHHFLFLLTPAIHPRMLITLDENLNPLPISVRVGQAVDVVGQAGNPRTITGFQTYTTPVLIGHGERAEISSDEYIPLSNILEGAVILKKNPNATTA